MSHDSRSVSTAGMAGDVLALSTPESDEALQLRSLERLVHLLGSSAGVPHPVHPVLEMVASGLRAETVALRMSPLSEAAVGIAQLWSRNGGSRALSGTEGAVLAWSLESGRPVTTPDVEIDHVLAGLAREGWETGATAVVPIPGGETPLGALVVFRRKGTGFAAPEMGFLSTSATLIAAAAERIRLEKRAHDTVVQLVHTLSSALDARDPYTRGHSDRVALLAVTILNELERGRGVPFPQEYRQTIVLAGLLHDLGKIGISDQILLKKEKLTPEEYAAIKEHPAKGAQILNSVSGLREALPAVLHHHESLDGTGYPAGLKGDEIPLAAQIVGLADSFDAITSVRPYTRGASDESAIQILGELSGKRFRPDVVAALLSAHKQGLLSERLADDAAMPQVSDPPLDDQRFAQLGNPDELPALPETVLQVLQKLQDPRVSVRDVVTLLASDQALVSELLRRVNSAYYGLSRRIPTVQQAVTVLGMNALHHLVISVGVTHVFLSGGDSHRRTLEALWSHSLRCAVTARYLGQRSRTLRADECFTAGILHDVGRLAMIHGLGGAWSSFVATSREKVPSIAAERAAFGFDHAQTGVWLAARWKLPAPLVQSIGRHHDPPVAEKDEAPGAEMARLIAVADWLAWESVRRESPGGEVRTLPPALTRFAGDFSLTDESLDAVLAALTREVQEADRVMGAAVAGAGPAATPTTGPARRR